VAGRRVTARPRSYRGDLRGLRPRRAEDAHGVGRVPHGPHAMLAL